ncbi:hypothetical protein KY289_031033 [Solanum tuberosum]|nr:hypothetical protein KY284_030702 [Solanum tuberosum]KAH0653355.1 hypothetical protein KY289_031033 [Solanum tuberosum]
MPQLISQLSSAAAPAQFSLSALKSQPASRFSLATAQCLLTSRASKLRSYYAHIYTAASSRVDLKLLHIFLRAKSEWA